MTASLPTAGLPVDTATISAQAIKRPQISQTSDPEVARKTARDFEAFVLASMFQTMFQGIKTDGPFGGGHAEETFRGMLMQEYGKSVAKAGGIGISDAIYKQILLLQEQK